jgi:uncharacterized protein YbaR (Trm112 family)
MSNDMEVIHMMCPYCGSELEKGSATFSNIQKNGDGMSVTYTSDEESKKSFFRRKRVYTVVPDLYNNDTFFCKKCNKLFPVIDLSQKFFFRR